MPGHLGVAEMARLLAHLVRFSRRSRLVVHGARFLPLNRLALWHWFLAWLTARAKD